MSRIAVTRSKPRAAADACTHPVGCMLILGRGAEFPEGERRHAPHVTPLFALVHPADAEAAVRIIAALSYAALPAALAYGPVGHFDHPDGAVCFFHLRSQAVRSLRQTILGAFASQGVRYTLTHGGQFVMHATVAYLPKGSRAQPKPLGGFDVATQATILNGKQHLHLRLEDAHEAQKALIDHDYVRSLTHVAALRIGPPPNPNRSPYPYQGTAEFQGIPVLVENKKGSTRSGVDPDGVPWSVTMPAHYGEVPGTLGQDDDPVDVFLGPDRHAPSAYVVQVSDPGSDEAEDKVFLGFRSMAEVLATFSKAYTRRGLRQGRVRKLPVPALREWLTDPKNHGRPILGGVELHKATLDMFTGQWTDESRGGRLYPVKKADKTGRVQTRWVNGKRIGPRDPNDTRTVDLEALIDLKRRRLADLFE